MNATYTPPRGPTVIDGSQPLPEPGSSRAGLNVFPPSLELAKPMPWQPIQASYSMPVRGSVAVSTSAFCPEQAAPVLTVTDGPTVGWIWRAAWPGAAKARLSPQAAAAARTFA